MKSIDELLAPIDARATFYLSDIGMRDARLLIRAIRVADAALEKYCWEYSGGHPEEARREIREILSKGET